MAGVDRRATALLALLLFALATVVALLLDGRLPAGEESVAGWIIQTTGHLSALLGGVLLMTTDGHPGRRSGVVVVAAVVLLSLVDALALADDGGDAAAALGLVRLLGLVVVGGVALRLAPAVARERRDGARERRDGAPGTPR